MKKLNKAVATEAFKEYFVPNASHTRLVKSEILTVIKNALESYGIASMTGKSIDSSKSPLDLFLVLGDEQVRISMSTPKNDVWNHDRTYISKEEMYVLEELQEEV